MTELSQLKWQCRRGTRELDIILEQFLEQHYDHEKEAFKVAFKELLNLEDPVLYAMLLGTIDAENTKQRALLDILRNLSSS